MKHVLSKLRPKSGKNEIEGSRFRFQVSGFRFKDSGFRFKVPGFRLKVAGFGKFSLKTDWGRFVNAPNTLPLPAEFPACNRASGWPGGRGLPLLCPGREQALLFNIFTDVVCEIHLCNRWCDFFPGEGHHFRLPGQAAAGQGVFRHHPEVRPLY